MKAFFIKLLCILILSASGVQAKAAEKRANEDFLTGYPSTWTSISSNGETAINSDFEQFNVRVIIKTHEVKISVPDNKRLYQMKTNRLSCTYGRNPCSVVDYIDIVVNNKKITTPRSVFSDLADLNYAKVVKEGAKFILKFTAADGAEGYFGKVEFNQKSVTHRIISKSGSMKSYGIIQETYYHEIVFE